MWTIYKDIMDKLGEPLWYDEYGVPRYCDFSPDMCNPYAQTVTYFTIRCRYCGKMIKVAKSFEVQEEVEIGLLDRNQLKELLQNKEFIDDINYRIIGNYPYSLFNYGDAPYHWDQEGLCLGCFNTSETIKILGVFIKNSAVEGWKKINHKEIEVKPWDYDEFVRLFREKR